MADLRDPDSPSPDPADKARRHRRTAGLLEDWLRGDEDAFLRIYNLYAADVRTAVANAMGYRARCLAEAEDFVPAAFHKALRAVRARAGDGGVRGFDAERSFLRFVVELAEHELIDMVRRHAARKRAAGGPVASITETGSLEPAARGASPSAVARGHELAEVLEDAVLRLNEDQRKAFLYRETIGMAWTDVARLLGRSVAAAKCLHLRAREKLAQSLPAEYRDAL